MHGISTQVQQRLDDLVPIEHHFRQAGIVISFQRHLRTVLCAQQPDHVFDKFVDTDARFLRRLLRPEQRIDERGQAVRFTDNYAGVFFRCFVTEASFQQLGGPAQSSERVSDFMSQLPDHRPAHAMLLEQCVLSRYFLPPRYIDQFDQQAATALNIHGHGVAVDKAGSGLARSRLYRYAAKRMELLTVKRSLDQFRQPGTMTEKIGALSAQAVLLATTEYLLCGGVQKDGATIAV